MQQCLRIELKQNILGGNIIKLPTFWNSLCSKRASRSSRFCRQYGRFWDRVIEASVNRGVWISWVAGAQISLSFSLAYSSRVFENKQNIKGSCSTKIRYEWTQTCIRFVLSALFASAFKESVCWDQKLNLVTEENSVTGFDFIRQLCVVSERMQKAQTRRSLLMPHVYWFKLTSYGRLRKQLQISNFHSVFQIENGSPVGTMTTYVRDIALRQHHGRGVHWTIRDCFE